MEIFHIVAYGLFEILRGNSLMSMNEDLEETDTTQKDLKHSMDFYLERLDSRPNILATYGLPRSKIYEMHGE